MATFDPMSMWDGDSSSSSSSSLSSASPPPPPSRQLPAPTFNLPGIVPNSSRTASLGNEAELTKHEPELSTESWFDDDDDSEEEDEAEAAENLHNFHIGMVMENDAFEATLRADADKRNRRRQASAARKAEQQRRVQDEYHQLTSVDSISKLQRHECECLPSCVFSTGISEDAAMAQRYRAESASKNLHSGDRGDYITQLIIASSSKQAFVEEGGKRRKKGGGSFPANKIHYMVNGVYCCRGFFEALHGISPDMAKNCSADAREYLTRGVISTNRRRGRVEVAPGVKMGSALEHEAFEPWNRLMVVEWCLKHALDSGAELLPMAEFDKMEEGVAAEMLIDRALELDPSLAAATEAMEVCQVRLLEHEIGRLYKDSYLVDAHGVSGPSFTPVSAGVFSVVFQKHPRLAHIILARLRDNFAECDECSNHKELFRKLKAGDPRRRTVMSGRLSHLRKVALTRRCVAKRALCPEVAAEADPTTGRKRVTGAVTIHIDAPSLRPFDLPAFPGGMIPKSMVGGRCKLPLVGVIAHKLGTWAISLSPFTKGKVDETIECIYHVIQQLQVSYDLPPKLYLQMDNHTGSNKTPAVIEFIAWMIETGVFTEAEVNFLFPGHTHIDIDQLFSAWIRRVLDRSRRNVTRSRLLESIRTHRKDPKQQPNTVEELPVRCWGSWFEGETARLGLGGLGRCLKSGLGVYKFIFKKRVGANGVELTYRYDDVSPAVMPRPREMGSIVPAAESEFNCDCQVTDQEFNPETGMWLSWVTSPAGDTYALPPEPPKPIVLFESGLPSGLPPFHKMDADAISDYKKAKSCIQRGLEGLAVLYSTPGCADEWGRYFADADRRIGLCQADQGPWFRGEQPPALRRHLPEPATAALVVAAPQLARFTGVDPLTHLGFDARARETAKAAAAAFEPTVEGGLVAVVLPWGTTGVPAVHTAPFFLARVCGDFLGRGGGEVDVQAYFMAESFYKPPPGRGAVGGMWSAGGQVRIHRAGAICGGLEFEQRGDLTGSAIAGMSAAGIKDELKARGLPVAGSKAETSARLSGSLPTAGAARKYTPAVLNERSMGRLLWVGHGRLGLA